MKFLMLFLALCSAVLFAQMPNISNAWKIEEKMLSGTWGGTHQPISVLIEIAEQNRSNDQEYFVAGFTEQREY